MPSHKPLDRNLRVETAVTEHVIAAGHVGIGEGPHASDRHDIVASPIENNAFFRGSSNVTIRQQECR